MANLKGSPHDRFVRRCLGDIELARAFFRRFLKPEQIEEIDLDALQPGGNDSFVSKDLDAMTTDLLYQAPIHNHPGFLSLLVEHKSEGAARGGGHILPYQMRSQEMMIMDYGRRNHPEKRYPLVHMVGLYHGERPYSGPKSVGEQIDAPAKMVPERWSENIELIDLSAYTDKELIDNGKLGVFLLVLKHIYATDMQQKLEALVPRMREIALKQGNDFVVTVFRYLLKASRLENSETITDIAQKAFSKEVGDEVMTLADRLREEGRKEGEARGEAKGELKTKLEIAKMMLADQQPFEYIMKLTNLTVEQIKALGNQDGNLGSA